MTNYCTQILLCHAVVACCTQLVLQASTGLIVIICVRFCREHVHDKASCSPQVKLHRHAIASHNYNMYSTVCSRLLESLGFRLEVF